MPKRKTNFLSSKLPFLVGVVICAGAVWALADYVHVAHADKVPAYEHRPTTRSLKRHNAQGTMPNYFKMSWVELSVGPRRIQFRASEYQKCERSRIRRPDVQQVDGMWLTARDRKVLGL